MAKKKKVDIGRPPTPAEVVAAREAAGLTQTAAAAKIYTTLRTWQAWEAHTKRKMHPAIYELFLIKTGQTERLSAWVQGKAMP